MERTPFDVVVSDLRMPGMNGVEFLKEVRERYPLSTRIIYSSYADQQVMLGGAGKAHQFLPKPCPTEWLRAALQRTALIHSLLPDPIMRQKVAKMERVVSLPALYLQLVRQIQSVETPIGAIAATVSEDLGMTAQILKIVNSAFFGLSTSSIAEAISHLGLETLKYLVLAVGVFSQFESRKLGGLSLSTLWQHSTRTAHAAKLIAKSEGAAKNQVEDSFAGGLLHDLGKLLLASQYPELYETVGRNAREKNAEWFVEERNIFGFDHAQVGSSLLGLWGLPLTVVEAVAYHHSPAKIGGRSFVPVAAVHAANLLVQTQRLSHGGIPSPQLDRDYLANIGCANDLDRWRAELDNAPAI